MSLTDPRTALVLGGGGITGIAWEIGLLHGLAEAGVDLTNADLVVGTSAGSVVGAQVTSGRPLKQVYDAQLAPPTTEIGAKLGLTELLPMAPLVLVPGTSRAKRRRIGLMALARRGTDSSKRLDVIATRIRDADWPDRDLRITAVDAKSGVLKVFDRHGSADLVHAVAASCAVPMVWPAVVVDGRPYIDGGVRSTANADLATGCDTVVVLAPIARSLSRSHSIPAQLKRTGATRTLVVSPDGDALKAIGKNVLDPAKRGDAARAGFAQAADVAADVRAIWPE